MVFRLVGRCLLAAALCSACLLGLLYIFQRDAIYPARHFAPDEFRRLVAQRFEGRASLLDPFDALVFEPGPQTAVVGTAIWFHGNGDVNTDLAFMAPVFAGRGLRLILAEYPGYGARPGSPSEPLLVDDARALYAEVRRCYPGSPVLLVGQSLGSGVAVQVASRAEPGHAPSRLVLVTPYLSLPETAARVLWLLPVRSLVKDDFDSFVALPGYAGPVAIVAAGRDELVGVDQGRRLAERARTRGETVYLELPGAAHDSWPAALTPAMWSSLLGTPASPSAPGREARLPRPPDRH